MCVAVVGKVESIDGNIAKVNFMGVFRDVSVEFINDVKIGEYLMVHAGYAIERLKEEDALNTIDIMKELYQSES